MKVKSLIDDIELGIEKGLIYNVFSLEFGIKGLVNLYIKGKSKYVYPFDLSNFTVVDNSLGSNWMVGINEFGDIVIGPKELFLMIGFWENYYNDSEKYINIVENILLNM